MRNAVIVSACRTPMANMLSSYKDFTASELGGVVVKEAVERAGIKPEIINEVIMGHVIQGGCYQNTARQAMIYAGIPPSVPAFTVNKVCGSSMKAIMLAAQAIKAGDGDVYVCGGHESMTNAPYYLRKARTGYRLFHGELTDMMVTDGLWDIYNDFHMGNTAELVSSELNVTREDQDTFSAKSQQKAAEASEKGYFVDEIIPIEIPQRKGEPIIFDKDESIRPGTTAEKLAKLKPAFKKDGTVTAGNASSINDGASAVVVMSEDKAKELGIKPMARIAGYAEGHREPEWVMMAPVIAFKRLAEKVGVAVDSWPIYEINEAFSAASVAIIRELGLDENKVNVHGGAVALGHPIGATGARLVTTLLYAMKRYGHKTGVAGLCLGGGGSVAIALEAM
ncbi:MAG: acetyl-CoA C-acetyltransferase [Planctomycetota bacterium]